MKILGNLYKKAFRWKALESCIWWESMGFLCFDENSKTKKL